MKKAVLGLFSFCALCGLAYYSSYLYSDRYQQEHGFGPELRAEQQAGQEALDKSEGMEGPAENRENPAKSEEAASNQGQIPETREPGSVPGKEGKEKEAFGGAAAETEASEESLLETALPPDSVQAETEYTYYLIEEFGYVNIYNADQETIYEYTEIPIGDLPEELQQEICTGKGVVNEQELYDFLENYSS